MNENKELNLENLYETFKKYDVDILKKFNNPNLSDWDYLYYAVNSDIMSNALSIVINILDNNFASVGIDNNARAILEAFVILKMLNKGDISEAQQKIFRKHYAIVEYQDFKAWFKQTNQPVIVDAKKNYDEAMKLLCDYYNCTKKELKTRVRYYYDPKMYLKKKLKDNIDFKSLLYKYDIFNEREIKTYEFFSIMTHPRFNDSSKEERAIQELRQTHVEFVLLHVANYLESYKPDFIDKNTYSFKDDFLKNPLLINNVNNINQVSCGFELLEKDLCVLKNGNDGFLYFYFDTIKSLVKDMMLCESLGYNEQVISKFKSFVEFSSVHAMINLVENSSEFLTLKRAFALSSKLQLIERFKATGFKNIDSSSELRDLYNSYYKDKYNISSFEEFEQEMRKNSLYFLNPKDCKNYNKIVKSVVNELFQNDFGKEWLNLYELSKDMNHASGYNFNSSPGISKFFAHMAIKEVFSWLIHLIINANLVVEEKDHKTKYVDKMLDMFNLIITYEKDTLESIVKEFTES